MAARADRWWFGVAEHGRARVPVPVPVSGVRAHLCVACLERRARFRYRGVVKADADHTLCFRCYRALKNSLRFGNRWMVPVRLAARNPFPKEMQ
jgi:hypothetical protein